MAVLHSIQRALISAEPSNNDLLPRNGRKFKPTGMNEAQLTQFFRGAA